MKKVQTCHDERGDGNVMAAPPDLMEEKRRKEGKQEKGVNK